MNKIGDTLCQIDKFESEMSPELTISQSNLIIDTIKNLDRDMIPLLEIIQRLLEREDDLKYRYFIVNKLLKFYGIGGDELINIRHKFMVEEGMLVKTPFLKREQKESINILLEDIKRNCGNGK